ncbi:MAG: glycosyltransferase family 4 protein [Gammaproteobacteria bacterium]|nr:glycosyltransferase family 4 protein [Gammaproteobacteria bacterium]
MTFLVTALLTGAVRRLALARGLLDVPNRRSSHSRPTPRGGGLAVLVTCTAVVGVTALTGQVSRPLATALAAGGTLVGAVGFFDDCFSLRPATRLVAQLGAALVAVTVVGSLAVVTLGERAVPLGMVSSIVISVLGMLWVLNLFNFMDGIDGIAASEAIFVALAGAWLSHANTDPLGIGVVAWVFAAACAGFLVWNWPPAKIFLGDVGSGYLGFVIALLALASARREPNNLWIWLILGGAFFSDATVTLVWRLARGETVHQPHRTHAYQWLALGWQSHARVTVALWALNLLVLLPGAALARSFPRYAFALCCLTLTGLAVLVWRLGAGRQAPASRAGSP